MQLKQASSLAATVGVLAAALLGSSEQTAAQGRSETSVLFYSEPGRVRTTEAYFNLNKTLKSGSIWGLKLTYDALSGASPTGGSLSTRPQTITQPSGTQRTVVPAGEIPTQEFSDVRFAGATDMTRRLDNRTAATIGLHASSERDYVSTGANLSLTRDLSDKTSVTIAAAYARDKISPLDGPYTPLSSSGQEVDNQARRRTARFKDVRDLLVNISQIVSKQFYLQLGYSRTSSGGYLTDPYKVISVIGGPSSADPGNPTAELYESRPEHRVTQAAVIQTRHQFGRPSIDLMYRYFWDEWGVNSHTADLLVSIPLTRRIELQPHTRWYGQERADFYHPFLLDGDPLPQFASADSRLADFTGMTYGATLLYKVSPTSFLSISGEHYAQRGDASPPESFGPLLDYSLFPNLSATIIRLGWIREF